MPYIGDVYVPMVTDQGLSQDREVDTHNYTDEMPSVFEFEQSLENGDLNFVLYPPLHDRGESLAEQVESVKSLLGQKAADSPFDFLTERGHLSIESVNIPQDSTVNRREGSITIRYLPDSVYQPTKQFGRVGSGGDFALNFYGTFMLPEACENVRLRSGESGDSVPIDPITTRTDEGGALQEYSIGSESGNIQPYSPELLVSGHNFDNSAGTGPTHYEGAYALESATLGSGHTADHTFTVPDGEYDVIARAQTSSTNHTLTVEGTTHTFSIAGAWEVKSTLGVEATNSSLTVNLSSDGSSIDIDYVLLIPKNRPQVIFDYPDSDYNVASQTGNVKVYDTNGSTTESDWDRVYDKSHTFADGIVLQNGNIRVFLSDTKTAAIEWYSWDPATSSWYSLGYMNCYDGTVYNKDWKRFTVEEISPTESKITVYQVHSDGTYPVEISIGSDNLYGSMTVDFANSPWQYYGTESTPISQGMASNGEMYQTNTGLGSGSGTPAIAGRGEVGATERNFSVAWGRTGIDRLLCMFTDTVDAAIGFQGSKMGFSGNADLINEEATLNIGTLPLSSVSNLFSEAENVTNDAETSINHWESKLSTAGNLNEFSGDTTGFTEDTTNGILTHSNDTTDSIFLNAFQFGSSQASNHYRWTIQASDTTDVERFGLEFANQNQQHRVDTYEVHPRIDQGDILIYMWDSNGNNTTLSSSAFSFTYGTTYNVEVEFDPGTGAIDAYVWDAANAKPSTPTTSATDSTYSSGYVGYAATGSCDLHAWEVNAEEATSSEGTAVTLPGNSGSSPVDSNWYASDPRPWPLGTYIICARAKTTDPANDNSDLFSFNATDGNNQNIGNRGITLSDSYEFITNYARYDADDEGDAIEIALRQKNSTVAETVIVDEFVAIPLSLLSGGNQLGPQDIGFQSLTDLGVQSELTHRRSN